MLNMIRFTVNDEVQALPFRSREDIASALSDNEITAIKHNSLEFVLSDSRRIYLRGFCAKRLIAEEQKKAKENKINALFFYYSHMELHGDIVLMVEESGGGRKRYRGLRSPEKVPFGSIVSRRRQTEINELAEVVSVINEQIEEDAFSLEFYHEKFN